MPGLRCSTALQMSWQWLCRLLQLLQHTGCFKKFHSVSCILYADVCAESRCRNIGSNRLIVVDFVRSEDWMKLLFLLLLAGPLTCNAHADAQLHKASASTQLGRLISQGVPLLNLTTVATGFVADTLCQGKRSA